MTLHLALCHSGEGLVGVVVSVVSAVLSSDAQEIQIHIHSDADRAVFDRLRKFFEGFTRRVEIHVYDLDFTLLHGLKLDYMPIYYYRLLLPIIHDNLKELIYLDTDLIVERDLNFLPTTVRGKCKIAAARDPIESRKCPVLNSAPPYINSGLMFLDLDALRRSDFTKHCLTWLDAHCGRGLHHHDQDAINVFLNGENVEVLDQSWNDMLPDPTTIDHSVERVIHIPGPFKPWYVCCPIRYREKFIKYLAISGLVDLLQPVQPKNEAQAVFTANQFRIVSDYRASIEYFNLGLRYRWQSRQSDRTEFISMMQRMQILTTEGKLRLATDLGASAFELAGFPRLASSPFQYPNIIAE